MSEKDLHKEIVRFLAALNKAEEEGKKAFTCPICGGEVRMSKAPSNGHIHARCTSCDMTMME